MDSGDFCGFGSLLGLCCFSSGGTPLPPFVSKIFKTKDLFCHYVLDL